MKPTQLIPGRKYLWQGHIKEPYEVEFVRRNKAQGGLSAVNVFFVAKFVGLDGPKDKGVAHFSDYDCRTIHPMPAKKGNQP